MFWLIFTIALWGLVHSLLASLGFKDFLRRTLGDGFMKSYRLLYNIFAVVSIAPVLYLMVVLPDGSLYQVPAPWSYFMLAGQGISALLLCAAVLQTDLLSFIGLRQLLEEEKTGKLVTRGFYRFVRHPLYTFSLLVLWLSPGMTVNSFIVYLALTVYVLVGAYFEERKLLRAFGDQYARYRAVTPMLIPGLRLRGNK
ncbi:MAG TPA: isoprenylcysteine carboxylmethyltransferase family protein [Anaerolineales bacterium]|nr:isoprenylcysteine carboxylmethyltransferase family protein [Anaerolineales bacterium]